MKENIIIKGNFSKFNILVVGSIILAITSFIISFMIWCNSASKYSEYITDAIFFECPEGIGVFFYLAIVFVVLAIFFAIQMSFCEISVTDKRVFGKAAFGKTIDLPFDKISSVGTCFPKGIVVATSSGAIKFWLLNNQSEVYSAISDLLKERQSKQNVIEIVKENSTTEELKKYKELLDSGVITQDEFDAKKKQLLGL